LPVEKLNSLVPLFSGVLVGGRRGFDGEQIIIGNGCGHCR